MPTIKPSHKESHFLMSAALQDLVIGLSDGLTVPFALAAGLSGAVNSNGIIITAGLAEIVAGAIAMGLGGYLSGKSEMEVYANELKREYEEVEQIPEEERREVRALFREFGLDANSTEAAVHALTQNKDNWVKFMMKFELGLEKPRHRDVYLSALRIDGGYIAGGLIPLAPYFLASSPSQGLGISIAITIAALMIFGYFKSVIVGQAPFKGALKVTLIGTVAAACAFWIAHLTAL